MTRLAGILFIAALVISAGVSTLQRDPGYMDADYYMLGARSLVRGRGFSEDVLWNYLDEPAGLPHPSHGYWLPATSVFAAAALLFAPEGGFATAKWAFVLITALIPPLTALLAYRLYETLPSNRRLWSAGLAGALALFPGYYIGFLTTTDAFGLYMVLGAAFALVLLSDLGATRKALFLGLIAGLMQLTRTDGFIWLLAAAAVLVPRNRRLAIPLLLAFLAVLSPWLVRNLLVFGSPLAPGGTRALWWTGYDDLFAYPASILTPQRWLDSGFAAILAARLRAVGQNLVSAFAVGGLTFLTPLIVAGMVRLRRSPAVQAGLAGWGLVFLLMSIVFPFAGARGGYFHAAAAVQPLFWAVVPAGLAAFTEWGGRVRGWQPLRAARVFGVGAVVLAMAITGYLGYLRIAKSAPAAMGSRPRPSPPYGLAGDLIAENGAAPDDIVMINNPPGFTLLNHRPSIVIPSGGLPAILAAAKRYGADFLVLGPEQGLPEIYDHPENHPGLQYLGETAQTFGGEGGLLVFRFDPAP